MSIPIHGYFDPWLFRSMAISIHGYFDPWLLPLMVPFFGSLSLGPSLGPFLRTPWGPGPRWRHPLQARVVDAWQPLANGSQMFKKGFSIVFSWFFMVFHGFFKELDFKELDLKEQDIH